ncbi:MAG: DNA repair protein RecN, partial [Alphaproteobacteria bacterium]|nr:DNA repair protein RecN [Alphaproteobacteria bacterium]
MLQQLTIRDIVLIEQAQVPFVRGLCVLSGETGAGKSILLDALGLAIGGRAEARLVRAGKEQGSVTAEFDISGNAAIAAQLAELGLEIEGDQLIIRRILSADGKSRCLINDQSVSVTALKSLGEMLVEIHGQHDQRGLLDPSSHRDLLDDFGNHAAERTAVETAFRAWRAEVTALEALREQVARAEAEEAYLRHTLAELETVKPKV